MINKVILTGRLTAKPELKKTASEISVTAFSVAVQRAYKDSAGNYPTDFLNCVAWRNTAEFICRYFEKGSLIALVGALQARGYEDKQGNKRIAYEVVCEEAHFVENKRETPIAQEFKVPPDVDGFEEIASDELPF